MNYDKKINEAFSEFVEKQNKVKENTKASITIPKIATSVKDKEIKQQQIDPLEKNLSMEDYLFDIPEAAMKIKAQKTNTDFIKRIKKYAKFHVLEQNENQ